MRAFAAALAWTTAFVIPVAIAGQAAPDSTVMARIQRLASDSSRLEPLAHALLDSLGPRLTGSPDVDRANDWLVRQYRSWGIEATNERTGTWRGWRRGHSHIDLISPRVRTLEGAMLAYSPGTGGRSITAATVILPEFVDSAAFVRWLPQARGKLVLVSAPKPTCRPTENWVEFGTRDSRLGLARKLDSLGRAWTARNVRGTGYNLALGTGDLGVRMEKAGIAGMITSRSKDAWGSIEVFETYNTRAPAIWLSCEDYGLVFRLTESGAAPRVKLDLDAQLLGERPVFNTVAMIRGVEKPDEYVVLSSHLDTWDAASGATDNGTGTLMMMEAMRILKQVYPRPRRTIISGHWVAEEQGTHGSRAFAEDHPEVVKGMQALFNQDNGTGRIRAIGGAGLPDAAEHLMKWLSMLPDSTGTAISYRGPGRPAGGGSDDASFSCYGLPAFNLGSLSWDYGGYTWHTNRDTYDKVVFDDVKSNAALAAMLAYLAASDPDFVSRERVDSSNGDSWPTCLPAGRSTVPRMR
jgi:carboxypeptidase Q